LDPNWNGGDYYDAADGQGPHQGLAVAREMAHITYRTEAEFADRFDRKEFDQLDNGFSAWQRFQVENYLDNQGAKLVRRFDANSYLTIARAMDLHDIGRGRSGVQRALARITAPALTMAIDSDALYPPHQQEQLRDLIAANGGTVTHGVIHCAEGHDGFLTRTDQVGDAVAPFLAELRTDRRTSVR
ncbi:MAG: alpha/beta fold hydrolase, partial [Actinobacteria bacterium]|nr:alpha/beta fold hydrolase [Actinomycetota bacterium]